MEQANHGHGGDIHDYLYSHFSLGSIPETNLDRAILQFVEDPSFLLKRTAKERYLSVLEKLHSIDQVRFATLNGFRMPNSGVILISNDRAMIERTTTNRVIDAIPGTGFVCLAGASRKDFQDQAFRLMGALHYPLPVALAVKRAITEENPILKIIREI